ncbi:MAG: hypothetical protein ISS70_23665 [Phycisphaerae bacterium]|nr:hypothetical protein [Phycisphaerae bacterium]
MNLQTRQYEQALLEDFGISGALDYLPPIVASADLCGEVTKEAGRLTGLAPGTPVAAGMFDIDACGLSSGVVDESQLCMIVGTWGNNQYISKTPVVDENIFMTSCYSIPGYYLMLEGSATSGSNLEWFVSRFFAAERTIAEEKGGSVYDLCNELVASTQPSEGNIIFLPFLYGSNANQNAKATFLGARNHDARSSQVVPMEKEWDDLVVCHSLNGWHQWSATASMDGISGLSP